MGGFPGKSGSEKFLTKIKSLMHFNLITSKIKISILLKNSRNLIFLAINPNKPLQLCFTNICLTLNVHYEFFLKIIHKQNQSSTVIIFIFGKIIVFLADV